MCHAILTRVERIRYLMSAGVPGRVVPATASCAASIPLSSMQSVDATHTMKLCHTTERFQTCRTNPVSNESSGVHSRSRPSGGRRPHSGGQANTDTGYWAACSEANTCAVGGSRSKGGTGDGRSRRDTSTVPGKKVAVDTGAASPQEVTA